MPRGRSPHRKTRRDRRAARTRGGGTQPSGRRVTRSRATKLPGPIARFRRVITRRRGSDTNDASGAESSAQSVSKTASRWRTGKRLVIGSLLVLLLIAAGGALWLYTRLNTPPGYWRANARFLERHAPQRLERMGEAVRDQLIRELTRSIDRPGSQGGRTRRIRLSTDELNAWLATRLDIWLANQGRSLPEGIGRVMVATQDGRPVLAFAYHGGEASQAANRDGETTAAPRAPDEPYIISLGLEPAIESSGQARLRLSAIRLGQLPVPRSWAMARLEQRLEAGGDPDDAQRVLAILTGEPFDPRFRLDSRAARVVGIHVHDAAITLTIRHEPAEP